MSMGSGDPSPIGPWISQVELREEHGTAAETWDIEHGLGARVVLRCPWIDRYKAARELLGFDDTDNTVTLPATWPYLISDEEGSGAAPGLVCTKVSITGDKCLTSSDAGEQILNYE